MKPEHLDEAVKISKEYKVLQEQIAALDNATVLDIKFFKREIHIKRGEPRFNEMLASMRTFLQLRCDNIVRRCNQIGLHLEAVVS